MDDNIKTLYSALKNEGYSDIGTEDEFRSYTNDSNNRKSLYEALNTSGYTDIGSYDDFDAYISPKQAKSTEPTNTVKFKDFAPSEPQPNTLNFNGHQQQYAQQPTPSRPSPAEALRGVELPSQSYTMPVDSRASEPVNDAIVRDTIMLQDKQTPNIASNYLEDRIIDARQHPKKVETLADVSENYFNKFNQTEEGKKFASELSKIEQQVVDRYSKEYMQSPAFTELSKAYQGDELQQKANEQFVSLYGDKIEEPLKARKEAYMNEFRKRYGDQIRKEEQPLLKAAVSKQVDDSLKTIDDRINEFEHNLKDAAGSAFIPASARAAAQRHGNEANKEQQDAYTSLVAAKNLLDDSRKMINEAGRKGNTSFVAGAGRGLRDKVFDADTWSMGITDSAYNSLLMKAMEKEEKGEPLTDEETKLLDAAAINLATQAYYSSDLGRGYKAGAVTGESIPFMLEFAINPVSSSGSAMAKGVLKHAMKKYGLKMAGKASGAVLKTGARIGADALAAAGMTATTGLGRVSADAMERMGGEVKTETDENGNVSYSGRENAIDTGEAVAKAFISTFLENQSEMMGNVFGPALKAAGRAIERIPGIGKLTASGVGKLYRGIVNNPQLKRIADKTQFHGAFGEYAEEVYNNIANVAITGDMTTEELLSLDQNIDTFLGVSLMSVALGGVGAAGLARESYTTRKNIIRFENTLSDVEYQEWVELRMQIRDENIEDAREFIKNTIADKDLSAEKKKERVWHIVNLLQETAIQSVNAERANEQIDQDNAEIDKDSNRETGEYIEASIINHATNERTPGNIVGGRLDDEKEYVIWKPKDGEPRMVMKRDIDSQTVQLMTAAEMKDVNAEMVRENVAAEAEQMSKYSPDIKAPEVGASFEVDGRPYTIAQIAPDGLLVETTDSNGKPAVIQITNQEYMDAMQSMIDAQEAAQESSIVSENVVENGGNSPAMYGNLSESGGGDVPTGTLIQQMETNATLMPQLELTPDNWYAEFGEDGKVNTPIGEVKMGENQYLKLLKNKRDWQFGMIKPTLTNPDLIIEELSGTDGESERSSTYLFMKSFNKNGEKTIHFESVTVSKEGNEVVVSNHILRKNQLLKKIKEGRLLYKSTGLDVPGQTSPEQSPKTDSGVSFEFANRSEMYLPENRDGLPDIVPTQANQYSDNKDSEESVQKQVNVKESIPTDEKGNTLYHKVPVDVTLNDLFDGTLESEEIDGFVAAHIDEAEKALKKVQNSAPRIGVNKVKFLQDKKAWQERLTDAQSRVDYWNEVKQQIKESRIKPGDEVSNQIMQELEPMNGFELAAKLIATGRLPLLFDSYKKETGFSNTDARGMFGTFASKENGGLSVEEAGEILMLADLEDGTNFFDQNDPNAGRNTIIEVLSAVRTRGDLAAYIKNNRDAMAARESRAEYEAYEKWVNETFGMSVEDYQAYEESIAERVAEKYKDITDEELNTIFADINERDYERDRTNVEGGIPSIQQGSAELRNREGAVDERADPERTGEPGRNAEVVDESNRGIQPVSETAGTGREVNNSLSGNHIPESKNNNNFASNGSNRRKETENGLGPDIRAERKRAEGRGRNAEVASRLGGYRQADRRGVQGARASKSEQEEALKSYAQENGIWFDESAIAEDTFNQEIQDIHFLISEDMLKRAPKSITVREVSENGPDGHIFQSYNINGKPGGVYGMYNVEALLNSNPRSFGIESDWFGDLTNENLQEYYDEAERLYELFIKSNPEIRSYFNDEGGATFQDINDALAFRKFIDKKKKKSKPERRENESLLDFAGRIVQNEEVRKEEAKVNTAPSEAQKEAGNYQKGHIKVHGLDITIEQPKGSVRSGVDESGREWSQTMQNTYGYIRGTESKDGDHIDIFLGDNLNSTKVFVVDQVNSTTGKFDEHKVMIGFDSIDEARAAYLSNYEPGWKGLGNITETDMSAFREWAEEKGKRMKPFADYKSNHTGVVQHFGHTQTYLDLKKQHPDGIFLFKDGDSYVAYMQDAADLANILGLTKYRHKDGEQRYDVVRFPINQTEVEKGDYLKRIVRAGRKIAVVENPNNDSDIRFRGSNEVQERSDEENQIVEKAKANGTYMLAPNGEPTNLNERQWVQVRTQAFKDWFGDWENDPENASKVVDENGEPMVVYHGTNQSFNKFGKSRLGENTKSKSSIAFFFTENIDEANEYANLSARHQIANAPQVERKLNALQKRIDSAERVGNWDLAEKLYLEFEKLELGSINEGEVGQRIIEAFLNIKNPSGMNLSNSFDSNAVANEIKQTRNNGHDGLNLLDVYDPVGVRPEGFSTNQWIAFNSNQIKSATENTGAFDPNNNDIRYRDESKADRIEKLRNSEPVVITGNEIPFSDDIKEYRKNANQYGLSLRGEYVNKDTDQNIAVTKGSIKEVTSHDLSKEQMQSVAAIPQIIEESIFIDSRPNEDSGKHSDVESYDYYVCGLKIGEEDYTVRAAIANSKSGERYYDHKLTKIEKGTLISNINALSPTLDAKKDALSSTSSELSSTGELGDKEQSRPANESGESIESPIHGIKDKRLISILQTVNELSSELKTPVRVIEDISEIPESESRKRGAKGWFDASTGEVVIVLPNAESVEDARETIFHEVVAHKGLRELFGKDFNAFLDNVYLNASDEIKERILGKAWSEKMDLHEATEEYLAELAERGFDNEQERTLWQKIKDAFLDMLRKAGVNLGFELTDNELRYILWQSYQNLKNGDRVGSERDVAMQKELGVGEYRFRDGEVDSESEPEPDGTIKSYEQKLKSSGFKAQEAFQDSMLALKRLQETVEEKDGVKLKSFENAYMAENQMSSRSSAESEKYGKEYFKPLVEAVGDLMNAGATYQDVIHYMMAKHGLERNELMSKRPMETWIDEHLGDARKKLAVGEIDVEDFEELNGALAMEAYEKFGDDLKKDYSGLTALMNALLPENAENDGDFTRFAEELVDRFEKAHNVDALWEKTNAATKKTLRKAYESGLLSKEGFEHISGMYEHYIPLRGWDETTASDVYEYLTSSVSPVSPAIKKAEGRTSLADDPIATIGNMAESTILQGNRNIMKQHFLNMVINHPTDLVTIREVWYRNERTMEEPEWVASFPNIEKNATAEQVSEAVNKHEELMVKLQKEGRARKNVSGLNVDYKITNRREVEEHSVLVKRNGKDYVIYINGDPRAAQALNGLTNPEVEENKILRGISAFNRQLAANFTTRNPAFVFSNLARDVIYASSAVMVKENPLYAARFATNIPKSMWYVARGLRGKATNDKKFDTYFKEFIENGGETGYTALHNIDQYKRIVKKELGKITDKTDYFKAVRACAEAFNAMNRWAEDVSRFNAYVTSRQEGRSIVESINDAKEITVNFNKKGAGAKTSGVYGVIAGSMRGLYLFFNAGVQGLANFSKLYNKNKTGFFTMLGAFTTAGFMQPMLNSFLISMFGDGGDDDYYYNLPEWVRRNNLCIYKGNGQFITIPLPIELRAFFGLGEMAMGEVTGKTGKNGGEIAFDALNQITELLPLNPLGHNGDIVSTVMPDALKPMWQINQNKDFTGKPIYRENSFNQNNPEWTKTYSGTSQLMTDLSEWTNELAGGDKYKKADTMEPIMNWNPAKVEHLLEAYFGGMATTINQTGKSLFHVAKNVIDPEHDDKLPIRNIPVVNRFWKENDNKSEFYQINNKYYRYFDEYEDTKRELNGYKKEASRGNLDYVEKLYDLQKSDAFKRYTIFDLYKKEIDKINKLEKQVIEVGDRQSEHLRKEVGKLKKKLNDKLEKSKN